MARKPKKSSTKKSSPRKPRRRKSGFAFPWWRLALVLVFLGLVYVAWLDFQVYRQFEGKRWALPAKVYARPLELHAGAELGPDAFARELSLLGYHLVPSLRQPGEVSRDGTRFHLWTRGFAFSDGDEPARQLRLRFSDQRLESVEALRGDDPVRLLRLEPLQIGAIHPARHEDRLLVRREEVPELLVNTLIAVEDRDFYRHHGISLRGIGRALWVNLRAGGVVQGGSTLTQQLVKNLFLSSERSLVRKANEAIMALLLERRYDKDEILEAYFNEVYLAQDGSRAIHGFGLASRHFFDRPLAELDAGQAALLVGMVKGPSYYDPLRQPERATRRRNLVLALMAEQGIIAPDRLKHLQASPIRVVPHRAQSSNRVPAFMDLVRQQLRRDYQEADLQSEGLRIFTTLDPQVQETLEQSLSRQLTRLERQRGLADKELQGAGVVTSVAGEVLAMVGDREPHAAGFNRALQARRPVGSLLKPAVFLSALEQPDRYHLATLLQDEPLRLEQPTGEPWEPQNYDKQFHGAVPLYQALVHSYNVATARLGLDLGIPAVITTLQRLGLDQQMRPFPSLVLGAVDLSPWKVTEMYQTFASGGFRVPLRAIREVVAVDGTPLQHYPLQVEAVVAPEPTYLLTVALQGVVREGTANGLAQWLHPRLKVAGKTGTTDDLRDSWFAGYSADHLGVIWIGRDDNQAMGLTGGNGAMQVWGDLFSRMSTRSLEPQPPEGIEWLWIDAATGLRSEEGCPGAVPLPFIRGSAPQELAPCARTPVPRPLQWLRELFQ
ncbi:MAG: penicillin-binding protein 1B [Gammaproteobacteria bacterium]|nr:penicillin-binding protein 1B [Gammaproteobacteria bacterium]